MNKHQKQAKHIVIVITFLILLFLVVGGVVETNPNYRYHKALDLGNMYLESLEYEKAIIAFNAAIKIDPEKTEAYVGLAQVYIGLNDSKTANEILQKVAILRPDLVKLYPDVIDTIQIEKEDYSVVNTDSENYESNTVEEDIIVEEMDDRRIKFLNKDGGIIFANYGETVTIEVSVSVDDLEEWDFRWEEGIMREGARYYEKVDGENGTSLTMKCDKDYRSFCFIMQKKDNSDWDFAYVSLYNMSFYKRCHVKIYNETFNSRRNGGIIKDNFDLDDLLEVETIISNDPNSTYQVYCAIPEEGYIFVGWKSNSVDQEPFSTDEVLNLGQKWDDIMHGDTIYAVFAKKEW